MDIACYHSVGVDTAMLYNGTTLNKALLLDWPVTLCVHLLDLLQPFLASEFLKKYETEFFEVVNPRLSLLRLVRKGVITEDVKSDINTSNTDDAREVLYHHLAHHANVDTLEEYLRVAIVADGYPKMQSLGRTMMEELEQGGWLELCVCVCVCMCACVCVNIYICWMVCVCVSVNIYICWMVCVCVCEHLHVLDDVCV